MATSIASVAGAVVATVASSGVVSAETTPNVARPIEPDTVKSGPVKIELDPTFYMRFSVNGSMGANGTGYEDYMRPIRVAGEVVYCVEPHVVLNGDETVTRAIPLSQGITLRKPNGTYTVSGNTLVTAAFINWFMFGASDAQINQIVKSANALHPGEGDQMRNIRNGVRARYNQDFNKFTFLMQQYYWWGASDGNVDVDLISDSSSPAMIAYWNEMIADSGAFPISGAVANRGTSASALNWMVRLRNLYANNREAATYNNDGYILEVSGGGQRLFSGATFTPKATPVAPPAPQELPMSISMQKKSTLSADEIAKSNGQYSLKDAQYGLFSSTDVVGGEVRQGALPKYTLITDDNGYAKLNYIESGTWYLKELKAPQGHQLDTRTYKLTVQKGQPEVHWSGEYRIPVAYTTDKPIEKVTLPTPEIGTTLKDDKGLKTVDAKPITLVDTVSYKNLKPGTEYTVSGRLMDKETGRELSPAVTATTKFTPTSANGTVDIKFILDASKLGGKKVVAFEKVSEGGVDVASHEDINDEGQTVTITKPTPPAPPAATPEIKTTLKDDQGVKEVEPKQVTLVDTVSYKNLKIGKEYTMTGRLMDKEPGKELSPAVTATTKFTPTSSDGTVDIKFTLDASKLAGKKVVAFEKVSEGDKEVATHEDINDEGQTVIVKTPNPSIGTTLKDDQGAKEVEPKQITLIDTVKYTNLIVGKEYEVSGRLMDKETGKELEPAVTATTKFKATQSNGSIDIKFTLDASKLAGKKVVAFEKVSEGGKLVAAHEDINDEDQTVKVKSPNPSIGTTLTDDKGAKEVEPVQVTLVDKVAYTNLTVGKEYIVTGRLMDKETGKELEPAVTGSAKFTPTESNGTVDVTFTLDASKLAGKKVVAFEKVSEGEKEVAVHEDINDEGQTIVVKTPNPSIGTTLKDDQGAKEVEPKQVTLIDTVKYTNLTVGKEYEVTGRLMDKETGKELEPAVTGSTKFTPTEPSGTVDVKFTFDASKLAGKRVVAFEKVSDGEKEVAVHEDINDEDQTVTIKKLNPEIGTTLINKATGDHKASPDKEVTLVDTVKYKNLEVGKEYEVTGRLMDKATGKEFQPAVKATAKFKPTASEGSVDVTFTFDASALAGRSVVAFEVVALDGQTVATHEDINDEGQTVEFTTPETPKPSEPKPKETPKTKVTPKTGVKGMNYGLFALVGVAVLALGGISFAIYRKKSHK